MSILSRIKNQVNPFDGGKTFNNPKGAAPRGILQQVQPAYGMGYGDTPHSIALTRQQQFGQTGQPQIVPVGNQRPAEDDSLVMGSQGLVPLNAGFGSLYGNPYPQMGFGQQVQNLGGIQPQLQAGRTNWQNTDARRRNMVNPQVEDNGFFYY